MSSAKSTGVEYGYFSRFLIRTPLLPFKPEDRYDLKNTLFRVSIYIASRDLYFEMLRYESGGIVKEKERRSIEKTLTKYWLRMQTRTTPFGAFSGVAIGDIGGNDNLNYTGNKLLTRLDMSALCLIISHLENETYINSSLLYYPNDSLYTVGGKSRYIESIFKNKRFEYQIATVDESIYLEKVLQESAKGRSKGEIHKALADFDETLEDSEISDFLDELIESKILISELTPCLTEPNNLSRILRILKAKGISSNFVDHLCEINKIIYHLNEFNHAEGGMISLYEQIVDLLQLLKLDFDYNRLFQVDTNAIFLEPEISNSHVDSIVDAINFCLRIAPNSSKSEMLDNFKVKFIERYESQMVSLLKVMDTDVGIGYPAYESKYNNDLLNSLLLPIKNSDIISNRRNVSFDKIILNKVLQAIKNNNEEVILTENDFGKNETKETYNTFSCLFEILNDDGLMLLNSFGDNSGAKLMSRFSYLDNEISNLIREITDKDSENNKNESLDAELMYLPSPRHGNIIGRPKDTRNYEVTCLSVSENDETLQLPISDLLVGIVNNKIIIKSKRLKKNLNIFHTNAFNYSFTDLPLFKFLGDLQYQHNFFSSISFSNIELNYIPRIRYKNVILSLASWTINTTLLAGKIAGLSVMDSVREVITEFTLPLRVIYCQGDNELYINFSDTTSCEIFIDIVKKNPTIHLKEFLFESCNLVVDSSKNTYRNQFNISLYKFKNNANN